MSVLVDPWAIPQVVADLAGLEVAAGRLAGDAVRIRSAGADVSASWSGLAGVYRAPEADELVSALRPVAAETESLAQDVMVAGAALSQLAGALGWLKSRLLRAQLDAIELRRRADGVEQWDRDAGLVAENNRLVAEVGRLVLARLAAERECANAIEGLVGGESWHPGSAGGSGGSGGSGGAVDPWAYGPPSIPEGMQLPWGAPATVRKSCVQSSMAVASALNPVSGGPAATAAFGRGELDAITGMASGVEQLVDVSDWATFKASWAGMAALGGAQGEKRQAQSLAAMAKGMVASDEWATDPARASGTAFFNVGSLFAPGAGEVSGVGHAAEGAGLLAKAAKAGEAAGDLGKAAKAAEAERLASELRAGSLAEVEATDRLVDAELAAIDRMPKAADLQHIVNTELGELNGVDQGLFRRAAPRGFGPKQPMNMASVDSIAAKYGINLDGVQIIIDKSMAGVYGSTSSQGVVKLARDAFTSEEQLARTLVLEKFHVDQIRDGMGYPDSYDAGNMWERAAQSYEDDWWANQ